MAVRRTNRIWSKQEAMKIKTDAELHSLWLQLIALPLEFFSRSESEQLKPYKARLRPDEPGYDDNGVYHPANQAGYCDPEHNTIWINISCIHEVRSLLLHEAVHAVASPYHGLKFCQRMLQLIDQAKELGDQGLVQELCENIDRCP